MSSKIDYLYVGGHKCGSTWLHDQLIQVPGITPPKQKEPRFFDLHFHDGFTKYYELWNETGLKGEFSTSYFTDVKYLQRIYEHNPDVKILINLRNPVDRAISHIKHWNRTSPQNLSNLLSIQQYLENTPEVLQRSKIAQNLENVLKIFPSEQIHINYFDDIKTKPEMIVQSTLSFLKVEYDVLPKTLNKKSGEGFVPSNLMLEKFRHATFNFLYQNKLQSLISLIRILGIGRLYRSLNAKPQSGELELPSDIYVELLNDLKNVDLLIEKYPINLNKNYIEKWKRVIEKKVSS